DRAQMVKRLSRSSFVRGVAVIGFGTLLAQIVPVLVTPLLTRLYTDSEIGIWGLYASFISCATRAITLGYSQAIDSVKSHQEAANLVSLSIVLVVPTSVVMTTVLALLTHFGLLGFGSFPVIAIFAMALSLIITSLYYTLRFWLVRQNSFSSISKATVYQS